MKCPTCGAWSNVLDTRQGPYESLRRRRECGNGHRFATLEVFPEVIHGDARIANVRAIAKKWALWQRDQNIRSDPRPRAVLAQAHGLTPSQITRIKRGVRR
jgi:hypothetical protein